MPLTYEQRCAFLEKAREARMKLSPEKRSAIGRLGAEKRWAAKRKEEAMAITTPIPPSQTAPEPKRRRAVANRLTMDKAIEISKKLAEVIDKDTHYYRAGSGYTDERLATEFKCALWSVKRLRVSLYGFARGNTDLSSRATSRMNFMLAQRQDIEEMTDKIKALEGRLEELETTIYGEKPDGA